MRSDSGGDAVADWLCLFYSPLTFKLTCSYASLRFAHSLRCTLFQSRPRALFGCQRGRGLTSPHKSLTPCGVSLYSLSYMPETEDALNYSIKQMTRVQLLT